MSSFAYPERSNTWSLSPKWGPPMKSMTYTHASNYLGLVWSPRSIHPLMTADWCTVMLAATQNEPWSTVAMGRGFKPIFFLNVFFFASLIEWNASWNTKMCFWGMRLRILQCGHTFVNVSQFSFNNCTPVVSFEWWLDSYCWTMNCGLTSIKSAATLCKVAMLSCTCMWPLTLVWTGTKSV